MTTRWTVVIPVKGTALAKSRLDLAESDRAALALAFAVDTVSAALAAERVEHVVVVTASDTVEHRMRELGAITVRDSATAGLNPAIAQGIDVAHSHAPDAPVAVLLGDIPALDPADLDSVLDRALEHPLAMVADAAGVGTVLVTALRGIPHHPHFGGASRAAHLAAGYVELDVDDSRGLRQDIDTLDDLAAVNGATLGRATRALGIQSAALT
jgi:2-phospho-L-lactate guanylyltransferase